MKNVARILLLISLAEVIATNLFPLYATYVEHVGGNLFDVGSTMALQAFTVGIVTIFSGRIAHRYHSEKLHLVIGYGLSTLVFLAYPHVTNPSQFYATQIIDGFGIGLVIPALQGLYSSGMEEGKHTKGWGDYMGTLNIAAAIALLSSGYIAQHFGYNALFYAVAAFLALTILGSLSLYRAEDLRITEK